MAKKKNTSNETNPPKLVNKKGETPKSLWETIQLLPGHILETLKHVESPEGRKQGMKNMEEVGNKYRGKDGDTLGENIFEFIDPTGMSSWDDVKRSINENGVFSGETLIEGIGAIPLGGRIIKPIIKGTRGSGALIPIVGARTKNTVEDVQQLAYGTSFLNIEDPNTALTENEIAHAKAALKAENGWTKALDIVGNTAIQVGNSMMTQGMSQGQGTSEGGFNWGSIMQTALNGFGGYASSGGKFAYGGTMGIDAEVEGGEVFETPNGELGEFQGPSHEQGGIGVNLPSGTDVFSERISIDGKTMAQRKKARERKEARLQKNVNRTKDGLSKNTLKKVKKNNFLEEQKDKTIQGLVAAMESGQPQKFAYGTGPGYVPADWINNMKPYLNMWSQFNMNPADYNSASLYGENPYQNTATTSTVVNPNANTKIADVNTGFDTGFDTKPATEFATGFDTELDLTTKGNDGGAGSWGAIADGLMSSIGNLTGGDIMGIFGNLQQGNAGLKTTLENRAGDTPNINAFKDYGKEGLKKINEAKRFAAGIRDSQLLDIESSRATSSRNFRNSARGVNTMRAGDLAIDNSAKDSRTAMFNNYMNTLQNLLLQEAGMENQQDQIVMQGEQARDLADRQDRDNFYTNLGKGRMQKAEALSRTGAALNESQSNAVTEDFMNSMFQYFKGDGKTGKISGVKTDSADITYKSQYPEMEILWKGKINPITGLEFESEQEFMLYNLFQNKNTQ